MCAPVRLQVFDFGPIKSADIIIDKYTVLLGGQGAGKSTLAKLFSLFTWLEKSLSLCSVSSKNVERHSRFRNIYCKYHRIESYFKPSSAISYEGVSFDFLYKDSRFQVLPHEEGNLASYDVAKVMYVPAERGYLSMQAKTFSLKGMPDSMQSFYEEFKDAELHFRNGCALPVNGLSFEYDSLNDFAWLKGAGYKVSLSASSSGFQSLLPLILVTRYLTEWVSRRGETSRLNAEEQKTVRQEVRKVMQNDGLSEDVKMAMLQSLSSRFMYSRFVNIVEEPEQNLYPESQMEVLFELLCASNDMEGNQVLLTTHSPYFVNFLTLAAKAGSLGRTLEKRDGLQKEIASVVPLKAQVDASRLHVYELVNGNARPLETFDGGLPSDNNTLNILLGKTNELFDNLLEIEERAGNGNKN